MSDRFFTNHGQQTVFVKFVRLFSSNKVLAAFDALVSDLRPSGGVEVQPFLEHVSGVRLLIGINVDSLIADYQKKGLLFHGVEGETLAQLESKGLRAAGRLQQTC